MRSLRWLIPFFAAAAPALFAADPVDPPRRLPAFRVTVPLGPAPPRENGVQASPPPAKPPFEQKEFFGPGTKPVVVPLDQAIRWALANNLGARIEEVGVSVEEARARGAYGDFDPVFNFGASKSRTQTPDNRNNLSSADAVAQLQAIEAQVAAIRENTNAIREANGLPPLPAPMTSFGTDQTIIFDQTVERSEIGIQARSPIGTVLRIGGRASRLISTFQGDTRSISPTYNSSLLFEGRQPLLKDAGLDANLAGVRIARLNRDAQELAWKFRLEVTLQQVVSTYYEMLFGLADLRNKGDAITAGIDLVAQSKMRLETGFFSPYEVQQARTQLSFDRENLLLVKNRFLERQFDLRQLVSRQYEPDDRRIFLPVISLPSLKVPKLDRDTLLRLAFERRHDYRAAIVAADAEDVRLKYAKNQRWPQVDLIATYGWNGLDRNYGAALNRLTESQAPQWQLGIAGSIPIGGIQPRAQVDAAQGRKTQALLRVKQSEVEIGIAVERAWELVRTNQMRVETARVTNKAAEDAVRIGLRRMEEGLISNFDLIEQQRRLYEARTRELDSVAELNKSITQIWLATGTVLENLGVTFDADAPQPKKPVPAKTKKK